MMASLTRTKQFKFEHVKPENVGGRFINAESTGTSLLVCEFIHDRDDNIQHLCPTLYKTNTLSLPVDIFKANDRLLGKFICIGVSGSVFVFQYSTISDQFTKFLLVDTENNSVLPFSDDRKYFRREYGLLEYAPLQCIASVSGEGQHCLLCLSTRTLRENAKSVIIEVLFQRSTTSVSPVCANKVPPVSTLEVAECKEWCHRANKFTNILPHPLIHSGVVIIQTNPCTGKVSIQMDNYRYSSMCKVKPETSSATDQRDTATTIRMFGSLYSMLDNSDVETASFYVEQVSAICSRSGDIICVCFLVRETETQAYDNCVILYVTILLLDSVTFHNVASFTTRLSKTEKCIYEFDYLTMVIPVFSRCDTEVSAWCASQNYARSDFKRLVSHTVRREPNLKQMCRSIIIQCTKMSDVGKLELPKSLKDFVTYIS